MQRRIPLPERAGVKQDYVAAMGWYRKAADKGVANADYNIGYMHEKGFGVALDMDQAMAWYRRRPMRVIQTPGSDYRNRRNRHERRHRHHRKTA